MAIIVRKQKNGALSYQVKVLDANRKYYPTATFSNEEDARTEEARLFQLKKKGALAISDDARTISVIEYWEVWSEENRQKVSEGWKLSQNQMYRDYVEPVIGAKKMIEVTTPEIGRVLKRVRDLGRGDQMIQHVYTLLAGMFRDAVEYYEMLTVSPVKKKFHKVRVRKTKRDFLNPTQAWKLLESCQEHYAGPAVWLQILAGLRPSEVQGLRFKNLLFGINQILICEIYNKKVKKLQNFPKQEDWDYSPMPPRLKEYLIGLKRDPEDFVAQGPKGGMLKYDTYNRALKRLCLQAEVLEMAPQELRHSSTELYAQAGASTEDIRRLLNHKSMSATKNYIHRTDERLNSIAQSLGVSHEVAHMGNIVRVDQLKEEKYVH